MKKYIAFVFAALFAAGVFGATEMVDGVAYTYFIAKGKAIIGDGHSAAIPDSTKGALAIPSTLGGCPVTKIRKNAFRRCWLTSVTIPEGVTEIGEAAFWCCLSLASVTIPEGVTTIGAWAFSGCNSLTSITIPDSVTTIGSQAFDSCHKLQSISVATINPAYCSVDGVLYTKDRRTLVWAPGALTSLSIPKGVITIGKDAFCSCSSLTSVTIPNSVTTIEGSAFFRCHSLTSVTIPDGVTTIGAWAFWNCSSLTSVTIPEGVTTIGEHAFEYCSSLTSVTIPNSVTEIGKETLKNCVSLTAVTIPSSVKDIKENAFDGCDSLESVYVDRGDGMRVKSMMRGKGVEVEDLTFVERS